MHLYLCPFCLTDRHKDCERARMLPFNGSRCACPCNGDPAWEEKRAAAALCLLPPLPPGPPLDTPPRPL